MNPELSVKEIAAELGVSRNTIDYRWQMIIEIFKKVAKEQDMILLLTFLTAMGTYF
jgi:hypothetical protein